MPLIDPDLRRLLTPSSPVLAFVPGPVEFERFVLEGAFEELAQIYDLHVAVPERHAEAMRAAAPALLADVPRVTPTDRGTRARSRLLKVLPAGTWPHARRVTSYARGVRVLPAPLRRRLRSWDDVLRHAAAHRRGSVKSGGAGTFHAVGGNGPDGVAALLDSLKPLFCVLPAGQTEPFGRDALAACKTAGVGCVLVQSDWTPVAAAVEISRTADFVVCWSASSATATRRAHGVPASRVAALGAPHLPALEPASVVAIAAARRALALQSDERLVLFGGARRQFDDADVLRRLERIAGSGRLGRAKIVYRPDPRAFTPKLERRFSTRRWQHVVLDPGSRAGGAGPSATDATRLTLLLSAADAVMAPLSPLLIDALRFGKPAMAIAFGKGEPDLAGASLETGPLADIRRSRAALWCDDASRLARDAAALLQSDTAARMAAARSRLVPTLLTSAPGSYAQRLATFCRDVVEPRARTLRYKAGGRRRATISHTYGAHDIAARYCRVGRDLRVPGFWMHGWIPEYHNVHPALIALHKRAGLERPETGPETVERLDSDTPQFVSRDDQARYLAAHGYTRVTAIGLPIVYLPRPTVPRVPGSLLVLPPHGHRSHGPGDRVAEELAAAIAALRPRFSQIVVGLTEDDVVRGEWVGAFRGHGLDVVVTAQQSDPDTLTRLVAILCSFEYVTTNGFGSQIAYAAYCGAKVSVYGPFATFTRERMASVHAMRLFPDLLDTALDLCGEDALRRAYPFLFVEPDRAIVREAWGAQEVGEPSRLPSPDLARAFGWPAARPILATGGWEREPTRGVTPLRG